MTDSNTQRTSALVLTHKHLRTVGDDAGVCPECPPTQGASGNIFGLLSYATTTLYSLDTHTHLHYDLEYHREIQSSTQKWNKEVMQCALVGKGQHVTASSLKR